MIDQALSFPRGMGERAQLEGLRVCNVPYSFQLII